MVQENWQINARKILTVCSNSGKLITYGKLAQKANIPPPNSINKLTNWLEGLILEEVKQNNPITPALVISKVGNSIPAPGFFIFCKKIGIYNGKSTGKEASEWHIKCLREFPSFR